MPNREFVRRLGGLLVGLGLIATSTARAQSSVTDEKPTFLVTDVVVGEGVPIDKESARAALATRFGRLKDKLEVRSFADAKTSLDAAALAQLAGATSDEELAQVEKYVQVDRWVIGRITQVGGVVDVQVKVFNVKEGITEVQYARRLGTGAPRSMVLTLLDTLADNLLAWTLDNYTDGAMSAEATSFANKKATPKPKAAPAASTSTSTSAWSGLGVAGGLGAGVGAGVAAGGVVAALTSSGESGGFSTQNLALIGIGATVAVAGVAVVVVDGITE